MSAGTLDRTVSDSEQGYSSGGIWARRRRVKVGGSTSTLIGA